MAWPSSLVSGLTNRDTSPTDTWAIVELSLRLWKGACSGSPVLLLRHGCAARLRRPIASRNERPACGARSNEDKRTGPLVPGQSPAPLRPRLPTYPALPSSVPSSTLPSAPGGCVQFQAFQAAAEGASEFAGHYLDYTALEQILHQM